MSDKHRTMWEDAGLAGVGCYVKVTRTPHPTSGVLREMPTHGGTIASDDKDFRCESCGAPLRLEWNVRLEDATP